ncbi:MAG TPA: hypothetical protein DCX60_06970 [Phycisphaerales bacterium]|nr:hypothetical protein [Phycisphaerales bacterium]
MTARIGLMAFSALVSLGTSLVAAQEQITVSPSASGRLYANTSFNDCCTLDAWSTASGSIWTETCEIMGGYCMGGKDVANWVFQMPDIPAGATILTARLRMNKQSGGPGSATIYLREVDSASLGTSSALLTYTASDHSQSAYFSNTMGHSINLPAALFQNAQGSHLALAVYRASTLSIHNTGALAPVLEVTYEGGTPPCLGDVDGDGQVGGGDLALILGHWGSSNADYDLDESGLVDGADLALVLGRWEDCP